MTYNMTQTALIEREPHPPHGGALSSFMGRALRIVINIVLLRDVFHIGLVIAPRPAILI
jgi:hypothetical protein